MSNLKYGFKYKDLENLFGVQTALDILRKLKKKKPKGKQDSKPERGDRRD